MTASFHSIPYERVTVEEDDDLSDLPPTVVTTKGVDKNGIQFYVAQYNAY